MNNAKKLSYAQFRLLEKIIDTARPDSYSHEFLFWLFYDKFECEVAKMYYEEKLLYIFVRYGVYQVNGLDGERLHKLCKKLDYVLSLVSDNISENHKYEMLSDWVYKKQFSLFS